MANDNAEFPLVSVIIPCYNHGQYLQKAIDSIKNQNYPNVEIIVVDDGSSDITMEIAKNNPEVIYFYQINQGLSAARNTGIDISNGKYIVFLDADDWLFPQAIKTNISYLIKDKKLAFVSGSHQKFFIDKCLIQDYKIEVKENHYLNLLQQNYIAMHAVVMYSHWIFDKFRYDITLNACEDYDLYLHIAREYSIFHHNEKIAAYRLHNSNMSGNKQLMLETALFVLDRQFKHLKSNLEKKAYRKGKRIWKRYYSIEIYKKIIIYPEFASRKDILILLNHYPKLGIHYLYKQKKIWLQNLLKKFSLNLV